MFEKESWRGGAAPMFKTWKLKINSIEIEFEYNFSFLQFLEKVNACLC
jgi:hypothetical protein